VTLHGLIGLSSTIQGNSVTTINLCPAFCLMQLNGIGYELTLPDYKLKTTNPVVDAQWLACHLYSVVDAQWLACHLYSVAFRLTYLHVRPSHAFPFGPNGALSFWTTIPGSSSLLFFIQNFSYCIVSSLFLHSNLSSSSLTILALVCIKVVVKCSNQSVNTWLQKCIFTLSFFSSCSI
jgi:hypothetical protein